MPGSSPLARGLRDGAGSARLPDRIIPARAGFTALRSRAIPRPRDHPRSRGVYLTRALALTMRAGSSPLARGLRHQGVDLGQRERIIPARAGFTDFHTPIRPHAWDHPRSRGVYPRVKAGKRAIEGSSPLARGLLSREWWVDGAGGIIPARAGFTWGSGRERGGSGDHPRSRGVYVSSRSRPRRSTRIIPARAGFTPPRGCASRHVEDHPRSRGVYRASRQA